MQRCLAELDRSRAQPAPDGGGFEGEEPGVGAAPRCSRFELQAELNAAVLGFAGDDPNLRGVALRGRAGGVEQSDQQSEGDRRQQQPRHGQAGFMEKLWLPRNAPAPATARVSSKPTIESTIVIRRIRTSAALSPAAPASTPARASCSWRGPKTN